MWVVVDIVVSQRQRCEDFINMYVCMYVFMQTLVLATSVNKGGQPVMYIVGSEAAFSMLITNINNLLDSSRITSHKGKHLLSTISFVLFMCLMLP